jgi:hypothetical protein
VDVEAAAKGYCYRVVGKDPEKRRNLKDSTHVCMMNCRADWIKCQFVIGEVKPRFSATDLNLGRINKAKDQRIPDTASPAEVANLLPAKCRRGQDASVL